MKISLRIMLYALLPVLCIAQAPDTLWTKTYGGNADDVAFAVQQTADGGYIIAGYTESYGAGHSDVWILKTDSNGDTLWTKVFGNEYGDGARDIKQTSDGGYIICGFGGIDPDHNWLKKTDSVGNVLWTAAFDCGSRGEGLQSVEQIDDGGFVTAGSAGEPRVSLALLGRTDSCGNVLWQEYYYHGQHSYSSHGHSVIQTIDGGLVVGGSCDGGFYVFKTDTIGNDLWFNIYDRGVALDVVRAIGGGFILTGFTVNEGNDITLVRLNSVGNTLWIRNYGELGYHDEGHSIQTTTDDGYIITGYTDSFGAGSADVWLIKTNAFGDTIWSATYGGTMEDIGNSIQQTSDGGYIIAGSTESYGSGAKDVYLIKTGPDVGIQEQPIVKSTENTLATSIFRGPLVLPEGKNCRVFDITGRVVIPQHIKPGIYFIEVDGWITQKVVKIK